MARARAARRARGVPAERWLTGTVPRTPPGSFLRDLPPGDPQHDPSTRRAPHATQPHMLGKRSWMKISFPSLEPFPRVVDQIPIRFSSIGIFCNLLSYHIVTSETFLLNSSFGGYTTQPSWHEGLGIQILMKFLFQALRSVSHRSNISARFSVYLAKFSSNYRLKWFCKNHDHVTLFH